MKTLASLVVALAAAAAVAACSPSTDTKGKDKKTASKDAAKTADAPGPASGYTAAARPVQGKVHTVVGVVKEIDMAEGVVVLDHEPVESLGWAPKTRSFAVKGALIGKLQTGQKVEFEFVQKNDEYAVTGVK